MDQMKCQAYTEILKEELIPAMGCTEPVAIAYATALARKTLGVLPTAIQVYASANIIKNVKSVVVPHTGGLRGISAAAAAGAVAGEAEEQLEVISHISEQQASELGEYLAKTPIHTESSDKPYVFDIHVKVEADGHTAEAELAGHHTNLILLKKDGDILLQKEYIEAGENHMTDRSILTVEGIVEYADSVDLEDVRKTLERQIQCNMAIAEEGLKGGYGASIGKILLRSYGNAVHNRAKAYAAAGSDARMNGCELPVVINSGSGNQGLTTSIPVIIYARELNVSEETLLRALCVANLVTIHMKSGIGSLSAYCGATSAGCGAAAGISYLYGGRFYEIAHTIVNAVAIDSGMICDGAKASCAAKIASAVEAGLLGLQMQMHDSQFYGGDGIVVKGVENTIRNVGTLAREGMRQTDQTIIKMMTEE